MIFKSIRWRLQIWYGLILVAVLVGFGVTAYQLERDTQMRHIDEQLRQRTAQIFSTLPRPPRRDRGPFDGGPPEGQPPPPSEFRPPPEEPGGGGPDGRPRRPRVQFPSVQPGETRSYYYLFLWRTGEILQKSENAPETIPMPSFSEPDSAILRTRGEFREAYQFTRGGECILSGCSIAQLPELRRVGWLLTLVGTGVLVLGLAGGGWIAARAIQPIEEISAAAVKIAAGDLSHRINSAGTDTELGRLAGVLNSTFARLEAAFSQQGQFTSDAAHELRTPVTVILTQTQSALARERTAAEFRKTVEACQRAAQRMRRLIEALLELARLDAGQETMKRSTFDVSRIARECVEQIGPLSDERGIKIEEELSSLIECDGDPERLAQVITNLLTNAIQYNKENGTVQVSTRSEKGLSILIVTDTGQGISAENLPHIFDRFYRADKSRSGSAGRTGLGLAISKAIVAAHGGTIEVSSEVGVGTTFTVSLPSESIAHKPATASTA